MLMRILRATAILALLTGPVYAQGGAPVPQYGDQSGKTPQQIEDEKAIEKAYKKSLGNVPDKGPVDPWSNARSTSEPKAEAKAKASPTKASPNKPKTKTSTPAN